MPLVFETSVIAFTLHLKQKLHHLNQITMQM